ncbi:MAG TPA: VWA domain-containing protein [Burkholderiales bacterium]|nr:VWA domain-containing protein [Burkholderiales bacterium]
MNFLWPEALVLLLAAPLLALAYLARLRRKAARIPGLEIPRVRPREQHFPAVLYLLAIVVAGLGAARPTALVTLPSQQRTIILAIDVSLSMRASDVLPNRLAAAQAAAKEFIREQPGDVRLGIVSFAGTAAVVQRPTSNREDLIEAIDRLQLDRHTAIGSGIVVSLATLFPDAGIDVESLGPRWSGAPPRKAETKAPPKDFKPVPPGSNANAAIILLTDGRRTIGPDPLQAARMAADRGVRIYTVGFGNANGAPVQVEGYSIYMMFDEATLKAIAELTSAEYFQASSGAELKRIYDTLTAKFVLQREQTEITAFFAAAAAALVIAAAAVSLAWFNRIL